MITRRTLFGLFAAAPVAIPAAVKAAVETPATRMYVGGVAGGPWASIGEATSEAILPLRPRTETATLKIEVDTSAFDTALNRMKHMSDFADDVDRYLTPSNNGSFARRLDDDMPPVNWSRVPHPTVPPSLQSHRLVYLGSPYTKYVAGLDAAFRDVSAFAAMLLKDGVKVYSPIAHTHPIAIHGNLDPRNHEIWLPFDQAMMDAADAMCIADMDGWRESYGVQYEIDYFRKAGKPVYFCTATGDVSVFEG